MSARTVEPELLDSLPADDPRAIRSRRDLKRMNLFMLQPGIMRRLFRRHCGDRRPRSILEIGCGDGTFMLRLARALAPRWPGIEITLLDRQDIVSPETRNGFERLGWPVRCAQSDVFDYFADGNPPSVDVVTTNLFLHHFSRNELQALLGRITASSTLFIACEPRRSALALAGSRMLWAIGCNDVSRHDAVASVRAGFSGSEISALWLDRVGWNLTEHSAGLFTHCFVASAPLDRLGERGAP